MTQEDYFKEEYKKVFTDDNTVKTCGRDECRKLIEVAKEIDSKTYYGDTYTGLMNIDNMIKLHERLMGTN